MKGNSRFFHQFFQCGQNWKNKCTTASFYLIQTIIIHTPCACGYCNNIVAVAVAVAVVIAGAGAFEPKPQSIFNCFEIYAKDVQALKILLEMWLWSPEVSFEDKSLQKIYFSEEFRTFLHFLHCKFTLCKDIGNLYGIPLFFFFWGGGEQFP